MSVTLTSAELALYSNPVATRVTIPHLTGAARRLTRPGVVVPFLGDEFPTGFRGAGRSMTWDLQALFTQYEHAQLEALLYLLDDLAPNSPDSRLALRTHVGLVAGLDPYSAVQVFDVQHVPGPGLTATVSFTATRVQHDVGVA